MCKEILGLDLYWYWGKTSTSKLETLPQMTYPALLTVPGVTLPASAQGWDRMFNAGGGGGEGGYKQLLTETDCTAPQAQ